MSSEITSKAIVFDDVVVIDGNHLVEFEKHYFEIELYLNNARNHVFEVKSQQKNNLKEVRLIAPESSTYRLFDLDQNNEEDASFGTYRCETKQLEKWSQSASGIWRIAFTKKTTQTVYAKIKVTTENFIEINPILLKCSLLPPQENSLPSIIADLRRGDKVVVGANVMATVDRPNGSQFKVRLDLINGLYFAYLTENTSFGEYLVNVCAKSDESTFRRSQFLGKTSRRFQRQEYVGSYVITENSMSAPKGLPLKLLNRREFGQKSEKSGFPTDLKEAFSQTHISSGEDSTELTDTRQSEPPPYEAK